MLSVDCKEERKTGAEGSWKKGKEGLDRPVTDRAGSRTMTDREWGKAQGWGAMIGEGGVFHDGWLSGHTGSHAQPP